MSKLASFLIIAASSGTCNVGGQSQVAPAPVEREQPKEEEGDRWAGLPEECRELAKPCDGCDEVERLRREILTKKCVPVCDAYIDQGAIIEDRVPEEGVAILESDELCGKEGTKCSPLQESACAHAVSYVSAGQRFRDFWAEPGAAPPAPELVDRFSEEFLAEHLDAHAETIEWASANDVDPMPVLSAGGELMDMLSGEAIEGYRAEVSSATGGDGSLQRRYDATVALLGLIRQPGDPSTWSHRRAELEAKLVR